MSTMMARGGGPRAGWGSRLMLVEAALAAAAFAALCTVVLSVAPQLGVEPDDGAYRASIVAATQGDFLTLSVAQAEALAGKLGDNPAAPPNQWVVLPGGRTISEKNPGYPFLAAPFQALGIIRWAPLLYGALACLGLFAGAAVAVFDGLVYGGPLSTGYRFTTGPDQVAFGLGAIGPNLRHLPAHLIQAMPMLILGLASLAWIIARAVAQARAGAGSPARRDLWAGLALAASWLAVWGLYSGYYWTNDPSESTLQTVRFYVPAIGSISLLGAWLVTRVPGRAWLAGLTSVAAVAAMFALGAWSFHVMVAGINSIR